MGFKKSTALVLIASQLVTFGAFAGTPPTASPEFSLLQNVIALQGEALSQTELQNRATTAVSQYVATASEDGQSERMEQALVDMKIYTPVQAHAFVTDAEAQAKTVVGSQTAQQLASRGISAEVAQLASLHPSGAQFSACGLVAGGTGLIGGVLLAAGLTLKVSCSEQNCSVVSGSKAAINDLIYSGAAVLGVTAILIILSIDSQC